MSVHQNAFDLFFQVTAERLQRDVDCAETQLALAEQQRDWIDWIGVGPHF